SAGTPGGVSIGRPCLEARFDRQKVPLGSMPDRWASASDRQLDLVHRSPPSRYSSSADRSLRTVSSSSPPLSYGGWLITNPSASRRSLLDDYQVLFLAAPTASTSLTQALRA